MPKKQPAPQLDAARERIGRRVRELRLARRWTQAELAARLHMSQNRLSEVERGGGSFTAEQLIDILSLFNVDVGTFDVPRSGHDGGLQNALIRHGATHLRHDASVPASGFRSPAEVVRAVLVNPRSERFVTALAPVLVRSIDEVSLPSLQDDLVRAGAPNRLGWLVENTLEALRGSRSSPSSANEARREKRAEVVLGAFSSHLRPDLPPYAEGGAIDLFDPGIRSEKTRDQVWSEASPISRRWGIVTALQVDDFADALRGARESDR